MLNLYKLEIFVHVIEAGSLSGAAERLLMTQSGVSQHIQDLEASLGVQLLVRGRRGVTLTPAGKKLFDYTRQILALVAAAENAVANVEQLASGQVNMGATPGVSIYLLAERIQTFRNRYPKLTVTLQTNITPLIVRDLLARRLDIGFVEGELAEDAERQLGIHLIEEIEQFVIVGPKHPFWARPTIAIEELAGQTFVMRQPTSQTRIWLDHSLHQSAVRVRIGAEFDNVESIKRAVMAGNSLTILPMYAVRDEQALGLLRALPLEGRPLLRTLKLIWDKRRFFSPITKSLLAHLQDCFPTLHDLDSYPLP